MLARFRHQVLVVAVGVGLGSVAGSTHAAPRATLAPRTPLAKPAAVERPTYPSELHVKFRDALRVRAAGNSIDSLAGADLHQLRALVAAHGLQFEPLIQSAESVLTRIETRAAERTGRAQPDLAGMFVVRGDAERIQMAAEALLRLDAVEWVQFAMLTPPPPCVDAAPVTPHYFAQGFQGYHQPNPGVHAGHAWSLGARGQGIKIADCEYGYLSGTEDLCGVIPEPGQTPHPTVAANGWDQHGTAVLGEMVGVDNGYGITGLSPDADALFFPEWTVEQGSRRVTAIANAIAAVDPGDIVVLEMQTSSGSGFGPAELDLGVWTVTKAGTDGGVVVVGAAGNGNQDLDAPAYATYRDRGDSGAILVGAGSPDVFHNKLSFSTFGLRVNVQGWGSGVFTTGYGGFAQHGGDPNQAYTSTFSGTSSATPIVASSAALLQSLAEATHACRFSPLALRQLLIDTGTPQGSGGHIGPLPNLFTASNLVTSLADCTYDAVCGNDVIEGVEVCDGIDLGSCQTICMPNCTCAASFCGNDIREELEACDGADTGSCPATCLSNCTCAAVTPGEPDNVRIAKPSAVSPKVDLSWDPGCAASQVTVVFGPLAAVSSYGYSGQVCALPNTGQAEAVAIEMDSYFFLIVANDGAGREGSYGRSSAGVERPEDLDDPTCAITQTLVDRCD